MARDLDESRFYRSLDAALQRRGLRRAALGNFSDDVVRRIMAEYGALFLASEQVVTPPVCIFTSAEEVEQFQLSVRSTQARIADVSIELQRAAMEALLAARREAQRAGLEITPRGGSEAARRSYADTVRLWQSRVEPALVHWIKQGKLSQAEAARIRALAPREQTAAILRLEARGLFFSRDFSKTILQSVAAPGASQHLSLLAFDVAEFQNPKVREILAAHGWFQTVRSDLPHFTFLGLCEKELSQHGLSLIEERGQRFWIPDIEILK